MWEEDERFNWRWLTSFASTKKELSLDIQVDPSAEPAELARRRRELAKR